MKRIVIAILILCLSISLNIYLFCFFESESDDIQAQEQVSEIVADQYIINIKKEYLEKDLNQDETDIQNPSEGSDFDYNDNEIYSYFDESYAHGYVDCVIEIPAIDLRQSVFTGDADQIEHDLSRWLPVTSRTDYVLGDTHYCIYMHNPRNKSIKISMAQEKLNVGDYMVVTQKNTVYLYSVTGVFSEWRNKCTEKYVDNENLGPENIYIFTCARGEWQGKNLVIAGELQTIYLLSDWNNNKDKYIDEYKYEPIETIEKKELSLSVINKNNCLFVSVQDNSFNVINCSIGVFNEDGYLLDDNEYLMQYNGGEMKIPQLPNGNYYIGIYECGNEYYSNDSYHVSIDKQKIKINSNEDLATTEFEFIKMLKTITLIINAMSLIFVTAIVFKSLKERKQK